MTAGIDVERIEAGGRLLVLVVRARALPERTTFVTPESLPLQVGYIVYGAGTSVPRHRHRAVERHLHATTEVLTVARGRCTLDVYDDANALVASSELAAGDLVVLAAGGHAFRMHEDTVLVEVKQGPYMGVDEKERF